MWEDLGNCENRESLAGVPDQKGAGGEGGPLLRRINTLPSVRGYILERRLDRGLVRPDR